MKCPKCNEEIEDNTKYCPHCGDKLNLNNSIYCPQCGEMLESDNKYCDECGSPIKKSKSIKNKKYLILGIIIVISLILVGGFYIYNEMNQPIIVVPYWFHLESNESGVETYVDNANPNFKIEIKDDGNTGGLKDYNNYNVGILRTMVDNKNKTITAYIVKDDAFDALTLYTTGGTHSDNQIKKVLGHMIKEGHLSNNMNDVKYIY